MKQKTNILAFHGGPFPPSLGGNGPPWTSFVSTSQMEWELWLNGGMEEREGE